MARPNQQGKSLGLKAADHAKLDRAASRLDNAIEALKTLENINGPAGEIMTEALAIRQQCRDCQRAFFESAADAADDLL